MAFKEFESKIPARTFIEKAFKALLEVRNSENGISELRLRKNPFCKKLIEEILPISIFLANFERPLLNLYCRYVGHLPDYSYDALMYCEGLLVERGPLKSLLDKYFLEVSIACHEKDYLKRECIESGTPCFSGSDIKRMPNKSIKSNPMARSSDDLIKEHLEFVKSRIQNKIIKNYPLHTYLIIPLHPDTLLERHEWLYIVNQLISGIEHTGFCGIFIYDTILYRKIFFKSAYSR